MGTMGVEVINHTDNRFSLSVNVVCQMLQNMREIFGAVAQSHVPHIYPPRVSTDINKLAVFSRLYAESCGFSFPTGIRIGFRTSLLNSLLFSSMHIIRRFALYGCIYTLFSQTKMSLADLSACITQNFAAKSAGFLSFLYRIYLYTGWND